MRAKINIEKLYVLYTELASDLSRVYCCCKRHATPSGSVAGGYGIFLRISKDRSLFIYISSCCLYVSFYFFVLFIVFNSFTFINHFFLSTIPHGWIQILIYFLFIFYHNLINDNCYNFQLCSFITLAHTYFE